MNTNDTPFEGFPSIITIDGPAASGKSTVGKDLAEVLHYLFFDTGVMYRAVAWAALQNGIELDDEFSISELARNIAIDVEPPTREDGRVFDVTVDGMDVTWEIRTPEVDATVSIVAAYRGVREALTGKQREIGMRGKVVMTGRDIGTVVLPEADLKIYLDASVEERARRRYDEVQMRGGEAEFEEILVSMRRRDQIDANRAIAPLKPAGDAVIIATDHYSSQQVVKLILGMIETRS